MSTSDDPNVQSAVVGERPVPLTETSVKTTTPGGTLLNVKVGSVFVTVVGVVPPPPPLFVVVGVATAAAGRQPGDERERRRPRRKFGLDTVLFDMTLPSL